MLCFCCFLYSCFWFNAGSLNFSHKYQLEAIQLVVVSANQTFVDQRGLLHMHIEIQGFLLLFIPFLGGLWPITVFSLCWLTRIHTLQRAQHNTTLFSFLADSKSCAILFSLLLLLSLCNILKISMGILACQTAPYVLLCFRTVGIIQLLRLRYERASRSMLSHMFIFCLLSLN